VDTPTKDGLNPLNREDKLATEIFPLLQFCRLRSERGIVMAKLRENLIWIQMKIVFLGRSQLSGERSDSTGDLKSEFAGDPAVESLVPL